MAKLKQRFLGWLSLVSILATWLSASEANGQTGRDSLRVNVRDSTLIRADTTAAGAQTDTTRRRREIQTTVNYSATDSIVLAVDGKTARLYGDAKVDYGEITLNAAYIEIDWANSLMTAEGRPDSTGKMAGKPVFKDAGQTYETDRIRYNIKTRKAEIAGVITQQGEGNVRGTTVFKDPEDNLYIRNAIYTTCNLPDPHFHISAGKIKVVKDKQIVSGPFNLVINEIPTPLGFAFGMFPYSRTRKSGIIFPVYGEETRGRGFFLRGGGYYWAVSDYLSMRFLGEIYSRGGWGLNVGSQYTKKYAYNGNFDVRYNRRKTGDEGFQQVAEDFWVTWSHTPFSKGTGRFSASVNAGTSKFNTRNAFGYGNTQNDLYRRISNSFNSNVSYSNAIRGLPITYGINARHDMNVATGIMNLTLPDFNLAVNRIYPFKGKTGSSKYFWQTLNLAYNFNASNRLTNTPLTVQDQLAGLRVVNALANAGDTLGFNFANLNELWRRAEIGARHSIPASMSMKLLKYFSLNFSASYNETWYPQRLSFLSNTDSIRIDTSRGFYRSYSYNAGAGLTTNIYGTFFVNRGRWVAIRHRMVPNLGFSYQPDFGRDQYGFYQIVPVSDSRGGIRNEYLSRFQGGLFGAPGRGESGSISFSLSNTLEAKLKAKNDTAKSATGKKEQFEKISLLDQFNISSSYNMVADSFNLAPFNISARTRLFQKVDINFGASLDPYKTVLDSTRNGRIYQRRINTYAWLPTPATPENSPDPEQVSKRGLGQITFVNLSFNTNLNPQANKNKTGNRTGGQQTTSNVPLTDDQQAQIEQIQANPDAYVDFTIPWSLNVSYNFNYNKRGFDKPQVAQALTFNGDVKLTDKWKIGFTSGYDFQQGKLIDITTFNIYRDLHCWDMVINVTPFGRYQSYSFDLKVKASILQDLKLSRRRTWYDRGVGY